MHIILGSKGNSGLKQIMCLFNTEWEKITYFSCRISEESKVLPTHLQREQSPLNHTYANVITLLRNTAEHRHIFLILINIYIFSPVILSDISFFVCS